MRAILVMCAIGAAAAGLAAARPDLQASGAGKTDSVTAILAAHKAADEDYAKAVMSPFTAVAVQYFQPGQTIRMGIGPAGVAFGPGPAGDGRRRTDAPGRRVFRIARRRARRRRS